MTTTTFFVTTGLHYSVLLIFSPSYFFYQNLVELNRHKMSIEFEPKIVRKSIDFLRQEQTNSNWNDDNFFRAHFFTSTCSNPAVTVCCRVVACLAVFSILASARTNCNISNGTIRRVYILYNQQQFINNKYRRKKHHG